MRANVVVGMLFGVLGCSDSGGKQGGTGESTSGGTTTNSEASSTGGTTSDDATSTVSTSDASNSSVGGAPSTDGAQTNSTDVASVGGSGNSGGAGGSSSEASTSSGGDAGGSPLPPELVWNREGPSRTIQKIWGSGPNDIYAVGLSGALMHSIGDGEWELQDPGTSANLTGVWGSGPDDVYVAVNANVILHSTGDGEWEHQVQESGRTFDGIWGSGPNDVYALTGGVLHRDAIGWGSLQTVTGGAPLTAIWGSSASDIYIATTGAPAASIIYHSTGDGVWEPEDAPDLGDANDVWGADANHVYAGADGDILFSNGDGSWSVQLSTNLTTDDIVEAGWAASVDAVFACTASGLVYRSNGAGLWSEGQRFHDPDQSIRCFAMWGTSPDNIYLGATDGVYHGTRP